MNTNAECCPEFHPEKWSAQSSTWENKRFIKTSIPTLFHIPFPPMIGKAITRLWAMAEQAQATEPNKEDTLVLFHDPSLFKSEIFISVAKPVPGVDNVEISGNFVSQVYDGSYNSIPKFIGQMNAYLGSLGKKATDYYIHYAYCPGCAKKFGHNYILMFAQV